MTGRERNIAIMAGVVVGALALDSLILSPLNERRLDAEARIELASEDLISAQQIFQADARAQRRWSELSGDTLQASAPQAESQALNQIREWAQQSGLNLTSLRPERAENEQGYGKITLRAAGTGNTAAVSQFLWAVQTSEIPVRVVDVTVTTRREGTDDLSMQVGLATIYLPPSPTTPGARTEVTR